MAKNLDTKLQKVLDDVNAVINFAKLILEKYPKAADYVLDILGLDKDSFVASVYSRVTK